MHQILASLHYAMRENIAHYAAQVLLRIPVQIFSDTDDFFGKLAVAGNPDFAVGIFVTGKQPRQQAGNERNDSVIRSASRRRGYLAAGLDGQGEIGNGGSRNRAVLPAQDCSRLRAQLSPRNKWLNGAIATDASMAAGNSGNLLNTCQQPDGLRDP